VARIMTSISLLTAKTVNAATQRPRKIRKNVQATVLRQIGQVMGDATTRITIVAANGMVSTFPQLLFLFFSFVCFHCTFSTAGFSAKQCMRCGLTNTFYVC